MGLSEELASKWTVGLEGVRASISQWESGNLSLMENDQDVTATYLAQLRSIADSLEQGIDLLLRSDFRP